MPSNPPRLEVLASSLGAIAVRAGNAELAPDAPPSVARPLPDEAAIVAQLERMLASDAFDASARNRAFLRYVVNETLAGRADHIKGYTVAQEVFQRDADFDPQLDPVVRIEASRVRRSLERYYLTAGKWDRVLIELPKGGYVPRFELREPDGLGNYSAAQLGAVDAAVGASGRFLVVRPFESRSAVSAPDAIALGLADELIGRLTQYDDVKVVAEDGGATAAPNNSPVRSARRSASGYVLQGSTRRLGARLRVSAQLLNMSDGRYLWVRTFDRMLRSKNVWAIQEEIASTIAKAVAGPDGALSKLTPP